MGKRKKVQCESCHSIFDNDFRKRHENIKHGGKRIKIKDYGAPDNPFVAAASFKSSVKSVTVSIQDFFFFSESS